MTTSILNFAKALIVLSLAGFMLPAAATVVVNTTADTVTTDGACSLREALQNAVNVADHADCVGTASDIRFELPEGAVIKLKSALPILDTNVSLVSPHQLTITRDAVEKFRIFTILGLGSKGYIVPPVRVRLVGLTLTNGWAAYTEKEEYDGELGGGAIHNREKLLVKNCVIVDNVSEYDGGGINNYAHLDNLSYAELMIENSVIARNHAYDEGGGVSNSRGLLWVRNSTIAHNKIENDDEDKAGFSVGGAGLANKNSRAQANLINSVISHNQIVNPIKSAMGGGVYHNGDQIILINSLIMDNEIKTNPPIPANGAGIASTDKKANSVKIYNSIVAHNRIEGIFPTNINIFGTMMGDNNIEIIPDIFPKEQKFSITGNNNLSLPSTEIAQLFTVTNGEYAPIYQLNPNSSAVDAGNSNHLGLHITGWQPLPPPPDDVNGLPRIHNNQIDIGPAEYHSPQFQADCDESSDPALNILNVAVQGNGLVNIAQASNTKTCRTACSYSYPAASVLALTPTPDANHVFTGWNNPQCAESLVLTEEPKVCIATFRPEAVKYASTPPANRSLTFISEYGEAVTQALTIRNAQTGVLTVDFLDIVGEQAPAFAASPADWPLNLTADASATVTLSCQPIQAGLNRAYLKLTSNDPRKRIVTYLLECSGNHLPPPSPVDEPPASSEETPEFRVTPEYGEPTTQMPDYHWIRLNQQGVGEITINGERCEDAPCSYYIAADTIVTLIATATANSFFQAWQCDGGATQAGSMVQVQIDKPLTCTAVFSSAPKLHLKVNQPGQARISSDHPALAVNCYDNCTYNVPAALEGDAFNLQVEVKRGWILQEWADDCKQSHLLLMDEANNCEPIFQLPSFISSQYREYNGFDGQDGYQFSLALKKSCIAESFALDFQQLGQGLRQVSLPLNYFENRCTVNLVPDTDYDSVPDSIEQAAGNGGDGNYDGIPDFQQRHVISAFHRNRQDNNLVTLEVAPECELNRLVIMPEPFMARLGTVDVVMNECSTTPIRLLYHAVNANQVADLTVHNRHIAQPHMQLLVNHGGRPALQSGWHLLSIPYVRNVRKNGEIMVNPQGLPVIEGMGFWQQTAPPDDIPPVSVVLQQHTYTLYETQQVLEIDVVLNGTISEPLTVHVGGNTLKYPPSYDYEIQPQQLTWYPGQTKLKTLRIVTQDDDIPEEDMQILLSLGNASRPNVKFLPDSLVDVFILDDEMPSCTPETLAAQQPDAKTRRVHLECDLNQQTLPAEELRVLNEHCYTNEGLLKSSCLPTQAEENAHRQASEVALHLNQVTLTHADLKQWIYIPPNSIIGHGVFDRQAFIESSQIIGTPEQYTVFNDRARLSDSHVWYAHFANPREVVQVIINQGIITHARIDPLVEIHGGTLDGTVINEGKLVNTEFMGDVLEGGSIVGMMTLHSGSRMQNVQLLTPNSGIRVSVSSAATGDTEELGELAGYIEGDANLPAKLSYLNILPNTHLSNVLLGEALHLAGQITLSGVIAGDPAHAPILLENVHVLAGSQLNNVRLGQHVTVDNGVILGDNVQISADANISCNNAHRLEPDTLLTTPAVACLFNHFSFIAPTNRGDTSDHADIYITLLTAPRDFKQIAETLAVAVVDTPYGAVAYMRDREAWLEWDGELHTLTALEPPHELRRQYRIPLYRGRLSDFDGEFNLYGGYRLANGEIVFNALTPLHFTLSTPYPIPLTSLRTPASVPPPVLSESFFTSFIHTVPITTAQLRSDVPGIELRQHIYVEPQHRQHRGEVIVVILTPQDALYQLDSVGDWQIWNGQFPDLLPMARYSSLPDTLQLSFTLPSTLASVVYVGYRVAGDDAVIVFNGGYPLQVMPVSGEPSPR